jgi:hypothetical protein
MNFLMTAYGASRLRLDASDGIGLDRDTAPSARKAD